MKQDAHPAYDAVLFRDPSSGEVFLTRSTLVSRLGADQPTLTWSDGRSYPVVDVNVSSTSHPFWTGRGRVMDTEGRVDKFHRRYARASS